MTATMHERPGPRFTFRPAETIAPSRPTWLWDRWLSVGTLHLLVGRQGQGKSTFAGYVASGLSAGRPLAGDATARPPLRVAMLSFEEPDERQVARLSAAGATLDNIIVLGDVEDFDDEGRTFRRPWRLPNDCSVLEQLLIEESIDLLIVDGLGYVITGDSHNYAVVGSALSTLGGVAERTGAAVVGIVHPPKGSSDPSTAAIGSTAWTSVARLVWLLGIDPEDEARRVVQMAKSNFKHPDRGVSFTIDDDPAYEVGRVASLGGSDVSAETLAAASVPPEERSERDNARDVIRQLLADGPITTPQFLKMTREAGLSDRTVERARRDLGVRSVQVHKGGRIVGWQVELPTNPATQLRHYPLPGDLGGLGGLALNRGDTNKPRIKDANTAHSAAGGEAAFLADLDGER